MKLKYTLLLAFLVSTSCLAEEHVACRLYYPDVERSYTNIQQQGGNLSSLAKRTLYNQMENSVAQCLAYCSGNKFKYCNDVARKMEGKK